MFPWFQFQEHLLIFHPHRFIKMVIAKNPTLGKELEKAKDQFDAYDQNVKDLTVDHMNQAPKLEQEPIHQLSQKQLSKSPEIHLKPLKSVMDRAPFNEKYRNDYNFYKEQVNFIAEHRELIGEKIEIWTKKFAGVPAEYWEVPTGKPVWGPRYLAERLKECNYHRLRSEQNTITNGDGMGSYYGGIVADHIVQRLDAHPVSRKQSIFMGAESFR